MAPLTLQQALDLAVRHHQGGRLREAEELYRHILAQQPTHAAALQLLGVLTYQSGRKDAAAAMIRLALELDPNYAEAHSNLGLILSDQGHLAEAIAAYRKAIALKPGLPAPYFNLGKALKDHGQLAEAIAAYRQALALKPDYVEALTNLGAALTSQGRWDEAITVFHQALAVNPNFSEAHYNLGLALHAAGQREAALAAWRRAIALNPVFHEAHHRLGLGLKEQGRWDEAIAALRAAIAIKPDYVEAYNNLGNALRSAGQIEAAIAAYRQALALNPGLPEIHNNLAVALTDQGHLAEALAATRQALALRPDYAEAHSGLAMLLLLQGDFVEGWKEHEWRWRWSDDPRPGCGLAQPQWDGSPLGDRTILLHAEQGFGDTLQFIRYLPRVAERGGHILVRSPPELRRLLAGMSGAARWLNPTDSLPPFDVHCPLMSLPLVFGTTLETIPPAVPYLQADAADVARWRRRWADDAGGFKVGLAWAGRPTHKGDRNRSLPPEILAPLARVPGVRFYSLQKDAGNHPARKPPLGLALTDWTADLHDFADTAAFIANLDLVLAVDTAVAHLAGALGQPVWTLLPFMPDWRWLLGREDSPWYPTMRLFRQGSWGDWDGVMRRVTDALAEAVRRS